jgi:H/ACA ribonucleoprotein complex subunit 3
MARHILKCQECKKYSMDDECSCGGIAHSPRPPKYSPDDKYAEYRRKTKKEELIKKGLY